MRRVVLAVAVASIVAASLSHDHARARTSDGDTAPEIQVRDWIGGDGRTTLADHRGDVVLLEFWNSH